MLRTIQERRQRAATLSGPQGLLLPINRMPQSMRTHALVELLSTLLKIECVEAKLREVERQLREDPNYLPDDSPQRAPRELYVRANELLSACHWSPRVSPPPNPPYSFTWKAPTHQLDWENKFVHWLLNLRASGELSLIRCCRNCRQWFFAVTNYQTFCKHSCRQKFHSKDDSFKAKRRRYMRGYRRQQKERDLRAKGQAKGKGR